MAMSRRARSLLFGLAASLLLGACAQAPLQPPEETGTAPLLPGTDWRSARGGYPSLAPLMRRVTPAVVTISAEAEIAIEDHPFLRDPELRAVLERFGFPLPEPGEMEHQESIGSGVIVDGARGHVITNAHLLRNATRIQVTLKDGRRFRAQLLGVDEASDIAILAIPPVDIEALGFADSDRLEVGDLVIAIGNPFGLGQSATLGMVSAIGRAEVAGNQLGELIQTDASINPGNSGGPLLDLGGQIVGINSALIG
ncbi:MAG: trypsin-like peptidase domain-containing protein, partial [Chromatiaceae bacterium]|nr:trypsin-like peptidase domain-containing protein [Chromatiaceae bacterium]